MTPIEITRKRSVTRHTGVVLGVVLVCIAVAVMLATVLTKATLMHYRQLDVATRQQQSLWLAESGLERAVHKLQTSSDYVGETWEIPAEVFASHHPGTVVIQVESQAQSRAGWTIRVESRYPSDVPHRVTSVREVWIAAPAVAPEVEAP